MKDKLVELLGGLPFFMMTIDGKFKPNKTRMIELVVGTVGSGVVMYLLLSWFALPSAVNQIKTQLNYIEKITTEIKVEFKDMRLEQEALKKDVYRIDTIQQERMRRENKGR